MPGLAQLAVGVADSKARLARRLLLAGFECDAAGFEQRGLRLSAGDRSAIGSWARDALRARIESAHPAADGSEKLRVELQGGEFVECVILPGDALCLSTQVGCAVGCVFCASGLDGLQRNLTAGEILEQVVLARRRRPSLSRVVYMGIGEPSHNLDAVRAASRVLAEDGGIPGSRQTLSSVGSGKLPGPLLELDEPPNLALSLHSLDESVRARLIPHRGRVPATDLLRIGDEYAAATNRPVQYAWTLLDGINCGRDEVDRWLRAFEGRRAFVNVIPWNSVPELPFRSPERSRAVAIVRELRAAGVLATVRHSRGEEATAACGQLRGNARSS